MLKPETAPFSVNRDSPTIFIRPVVYSIARTICLTLELGLCYLPENRLLLV